MYGKLRCQQPVTASHLTEFCSGQHQPTTLTHGGKFSTLILRVNRPDTHLECGARKMQAVAYSHLPRKHSAGHRYANAFDNKNAVNRQPKMSSLLEGLCHGKRQERRFKRGNTHTLTR